MHTNRLITPIILLFPLLSGCNKQPIAETPIKVKAFQLGINSNQTKLYYSGTIEAGKNIALSFLTMGTVAEVLVREGDRVKNGQLLARLDCRSNKDAFQIAQEKAKQAEDAFNRFKPMFEHGNLPEIKMVEIRTAKTQSELAVKMAEKNVEDCSVRAPEDGIVSDRSIEPGDTVIPGKTAMKLVAVDKIYAIISVPEQEIKKIKRGLPAEIVLSGQDNARMEGKVSDVGVVADPLSRTYMARVLVNNADTKALPGMLCSVYMARGAGAAHVVIPATAIKMDGENKQFVFVVDPSSRRVRKIAVTSSGFRESGVMISSGLQGNELLVREGVQKLDDNMMVEIAP